MHVDELKKQMAKSLEEGDESKIDVAYTAWKTVNGVLKNIQTQLTVIQQAQESEENRVKNTQLNEGENPIETEGGNENDEG